MTRKPHNHVEILMYRTGDFVVETRSPFLSVYPSKGLVVEGQILK